MLIPKRAEIKNIYLETASYLSLVQVWDKIQFVMVIYDEHVTYYKPGSSPSAFVLS